MQGTALTCAIENNLTEIAKLLIEKKADIGSDYLYRIDRWHNAPHCMRRLHKDFDPRLTPFLLAAKCNNRELISFFMEHGAAELNACDSHQKTAIDLTTDMDISQLLLLRYSPQERLNRIQFKGKIPQELICAVSGKIMKRPVTDQYGNTFCKEELVKENLRAIESDHLLRGPKKTRISLENYTNLMELPVRQDLALKCKEFVLSEEEKAFKLITLPPSAKRFKGI